MLPETRDTSVGVFVWGHVGVHQRSQRSQVQFGTREVWAVPFQTSQRRHQADSTWRVQSSVRIARTRGHQGSKMLSEAFRSPKER